VPCLPFVLGLWPLSGGCCRECLAPLFNRSGSFSLTATLLLAGEEALELERGQLLQVLGPA
jgi:hypothetical protein